MTTNQSPAQELDLDKLQRFNNRGGLMNPEPWGLYVRFEELAQARAARQAQPVDAGVQAATGPAAPVKTWRERLPAGAGISYDYAHVCAMKAEIADLRAALAQAAPADLTDERVRFENWAELTEHQKRGAQHEVVGWYYFDDLTNDRWEAWQARAAVVAIPAPAGDLIAECIAAMNRAYPLPITKELAEAQDAMAKREAYRHGWIDRGLAAPAAQSQEATNSDCEVKS